MASKDKLGFSVGYRHTGLLTVWKGNYTIHLFPKPREWRVGPWPRDSVERAYGLDSFGFGPLLLICKMG